MKLIYFSTESFETGEDYDLHIFMMLTNKDYKNLEKIPFSDIYHMYEHCKDASIGCWNAQSFSENDDLKLTGSVFSPNDMRFITPLFV